MEPPYGYLVNFFRHVFNGSYQLRIQTKGTHEPVATYFTTPGTRQLTQAK